MKPKRRSKAVPATLTAMIAATLAGCSGGYQRCVDGKGMTLADVYCGVNPPALPANAIPPAHWVRSGGYSSGVHTGGWFGGFRSGGGSVGGGTSSSHSSGSVSRGGFGGFGGFGG